MSGDTSEEVAEIDRRNFLKAVGAGVSLSAIDLLSEDEAQIGDITYNPEEEVPYVAGWKNYFNEDNEVTKDPVYSSMPIERWDRIQATRDAINTLSEVLEESELDEDPFLFLQTTDKSSPNGRRIDIAHFSDTPYNTDTLEETFPTSITGDKDYSDDTFDIPVGIKEIESGLESCDSSPPSDCDEDACYARTNNGEYRKFDDVSGGAPIHTDDNDKNSGVIAGPYMHSQHGEGWITAHHVIAEGEDDNVIGYDVDLASNLCSGYAEKIGEVANAIRDERSTGLFSSAEIDLAFIEKTESDKDAHEWIASPGYLSNEDLPLTTVIADTELENVKGNSGWNLKVQGQRTCRSDSYVDTVVKDTNGEVIGGLLDDHYTNNTDSGGPVFHEENDEAYICGVHKGCIGGKSYFNTAETTEDYLSGNWMAQ